MRCRGVRIYGLFVLTGGVLFALLASTRASAPAPSPANAPDSRAPSAPPPAIDPWAVTLPSPSEPAIVDPPPPVIAGPARAEVPVEPAAGPAFAAAPGQIQLLAIAHDGRAAVTGDETRSVRLWPTLDGKREPLVVPMQPPAMLAIARDRDAFVIASVDSLGQLELVRVAATGQVTRRIEVGLERALVTIHATPLGFVALRDDRVVVSIGLDGMIGAELTADPGEHVLSLAVRDDRVLAIIERDERPYGRWIDLSTGTWSERTRALPIKGERVVLSPNRERVAGFARGKRKAVAIVDLATGKIVDTMKDLDDSTELVGFRSDRDVWVTANHTAQSSRGDSLDGSVVEIANDRVVSSAGSALAVWRPDRQPTYLGYRMGFLAEVRATPTGFFATDGRRLVELDAKLRTRAGYEVEQLPQNFGQIALVDGGHALGLSYSSQYSLYLFSTKLGTSTLVASGVNRFEYEPTSRLLSYATRDRVHVARFDPETLTFEPAIALQAKPGEVALLDATDKKGEVAIVVQGTSRKYVATFGTIGTTGFEKTTERTITPTDEWWSSDGDPRSLVRNHSRARSPDGSLVAEIRDQRLLLREGTSVRWTMPTVATRPVWTASGELVVFGAGLARVDLASGALRERQCGSWFGAWDYLPEAHGVSALCEVP